MWCRITNRFFCFRLSLASLCLFFCNQTQPAAQDATAVAPKISTNVPPESLGENTELQAAKKNKKNHLAEAKNHLAQEEQSLVRAKTERDQAKQHLDAAFKKWRKEKDPKAKDYLQGLVDEARDDVVEAKQEVREAKARVDRANNYVFHLLMASNGTLLRTMSFVFFPSLWLLFVVFFLFLLRV